MTLDPRRRGLLLALLLLAVAGVWLGVTAAEGVDERRLFGLWRARSLLAGLTLAAAAAAVLLRTLSRRVYVSTLRITGVLLVTAMLFELVGLAGLLSYQGLFDLADRGPAEGVGSRARPYLAVSGWAPQDLAERYGFPAPLIRFRYQAGPHGFRNPRDRHEGDVILLGDSILVAGLLPYEQTLASRLEARLARPVKNVALVGLAPQQQLELLSDLDVPLDGRLVLQFVFEGNDLLDSARHRRPPPPRQERWLRDRSLLHNAIVWLQHRTDPIHPEGRRRSGRIGDQTYAFLWGCGLRSDPQVEIDEIGPVCDTVAAVHELVARRGGSHAVVYVPAKLRVLGPLCVWPEGSDLADHERYLSPLRDALVRRCADQGIPLLDLTDALSAAAARGPIPWFPFDTHPNGTGHAVAAGAVADWELVRTWREAGDD